MSNIDDIRRLKVNSTSYGALPLTAFLMGRFPANATLQYETKWRFVGKSAPLALHSSYTPR